MHTELFDILEAHPDCYFQIFTNGQFITDEKAQRLAQLGNATPLISIEGLDIESPAEPRLVEAPRRDGNDRDLESRREHVRRDLFRIALPQRRVSLDSQSLAHRLDAGVLEFTFDRADRDAANAAKAEDGEAGGPPENLPVQVQ
jgi:MoaA/NifB/PqqE/SkfB family radical SAM enzyme